MDLFSSLICTAIILDLFGRFFWAFTLEQSSLIRPDFFVIVVSSVEIARRAMWGFFRVEYETLSNYEQYRQFDLVPKLSTGPLKTKKLKRFKTVALGATSEVSTTTSSNFSFNEGTDNHSLFNTDTTTNQKMTVSKELPNIQFQRDASNEWTESQEFGNEQTTLNSTHLFKNDPLLLPPISQSVDGALNIQDHDFFFENLPVHSFGTLSTTAPHRSNVHRSAMDNDNDLSS
jgi:hypothetical protein